MTIRTFFFKTVSHALLMCGLLGGFASVSAQAQQTQRQAPVGSLRFVVGFAPGGVPDSAARVVAHKLSEDWKFQVLVESKLGAGGTLAAQAVLNAPANGTTLLSVSPAHATAPAIFTKLPYDTLKDFTPVTLVAKGPALLVVPNDLGVKTVAELVALAKAKPGQLNYSSAGIGSSSHFAAELLRMHAGIDVVHVPYKGVAEALTEVVAGRTQFLIAPYTTAIQLVKEGKVRALAATGAKRIPELPELPTVAESGVPGYEWLFWYGFLASAKTPAPVIAQLHAEIKRALNSPDVQRRLEPMGVEIIAGSPEEFQKLIVAEIANFSRIAKAAQIKPE